MSIKKKLQSSIQSVNEVDPIDASMSLGAWQIPGIGGGQAGWDITEPVTSVKQNVADSIQGITNSIPQIASLALSSIFGGGKGEKKPKGLMYPKTLGNSKLNPAHINFQYYKKNVISDTIDLPMPDQVTNPSTINWAQENFGMIGNAVASSLKQVGSDQIANGEDIGKSIAAMGERIKTLAFYNVTSSAIGQAGGSVSAEGLMGAVGGKIPNPYHTMLFRGVEFRNFSFVFKFTPFTESDCELIDAIINTMRSHAYPDFSTDNQFFEYPDECQITYVWENNPNKWLHQFKRAVCTGIDVEYSSNGTWSSMRNGFPTLITVSTRWSETQVVTRGDIVSKNKKGQSF